MTDELFRQVCLDCGERIHSTNGNFEPHSCNNFHDDERENDDV